MTMRSWQVEQIRTCQSLPRSSGVRHNMLKVQVPMMDLTGIVYKNMK
jgi:hypothetical protein